MLGINTENWLSIYKSTPGRRAFATSQIQGAVADRYPIIAQLAAESRAHDEGAVALARQWAETRVNEAGAAQNQRAIAADQLCDRMLGSTARLLTEVAALSGPKAQAASRILRQCFPEGVDKITTLSFAEANTAVRLILDELRGPLASDVAACGAADHVAALEAAFKELDAAVREQKQPRALEYEAVRNADREGQRRFSDLIVAILFHTRGPEGAADRARLLHPVEVQNEALRELFRSRRRVPDVDPQTGVTVEELDPGTPTPLEGSAPA